MIELTEATLFVEAGRKGERGGGGGGGVWEVLGGGSIGGNSFFGLEGGVKGFASIGSSGVKGGT